MSWRLVNGTPGANPNRTRSLKTTTNSSSRSRPDSANASTPATVMGRRVSMLLLLSMTSPMATGTSRLPKNSIRWGTPSSSTWKADWGSASTASDFASRTFTWSTTRSECVVNTATGLVCVESATGLGGAVVAVCSSCAPSAVTATRCITEIGSRETRQLLWLIVSVPVW